MRFRLKIAQEVERHFPCGQSFCLRRLVFCTFDPVEGTKSRRYGEFRWFQDWPRTCNNTGHQDIARDRQGVSAWFQG